MGSIPADARIWGDLFPLIDALRLTQLLALTVWSRFFVAIRIYFSFVYFLYTSPENGLFQLSLTNPWLYYDSSLSSKPRTVCLLIMVARFSDTSSPFRGNHIAVCTPKFTIRPEVFRYPSVYTRNELSLFPAPSVDQKALRLQVDVLIFLSTTSWGGRCDVICGLLPTAYFSKMTEFILIDVAPSGYRTTDGWHQDRSPSVYHDHPITWRPSPDVSC